MRRRFSPWWLCATLVLACEREPARGALGESCTRRDDCAQGLSCLAQVCTTADAGAETSGASAAAGLGGSCSARRDCREGLVCSEGECMRASAGVDPGTRYSGRGESCQAKNDCSPELACVQGTCREVSLALPHTPKGCHRVECESAEECCADFVPNANCEAYRDNCETDPIFCNTYRSLCECNEDCEDEVCVAVAPGCTEDAECTSQQTPHCVDGRCAQCRMDSHCPGTATRCSQGVCMAGCERDEHCPLLHACQDGTCEAVGCGSDRECVFVTDDPRAACRETECKVPCEADTDCANDRERFQICAQGECVFVGCETDAECRALLGLERQTDDVRALCR